MATKVVKKLSPHRNYTTIILAFIILFCIYFIARLAADKQELTQKNQAMMAYLHATTGLLDPVYGNRPPLQVTDQNKTFRNKFLGLTFEMPVGWYFKAQPGQATIFSETQNHGSQGFITIGTNQNTAEYVSENALKKGDYSIKMYAGYLIPPANSSRTQHVVINGKPAIKVIRHFRNKNENTKSVKDIVEETYYFSYRTFNFELQAISSAEGNPDFKQFDQMVQSITFAE